jgi:signal transduction histidine kinase
LLVSADRQRVRQIILNLISNAIKFTPDGGTITVACEQAAGGMEQAAELAVVIGMPSAALRLPPAASPAFARISVTDTGIGIREEDVPKLFEKFRQLDGSHNRKYEGTGLGLALTKQLVELHGGTVAVASTFGAGTTFSFTLPLTTDHPENGVSAPAHDSQLTPTH